ncbi:hypothetical protein [Bacillus sp. JCM 19034]|uniref:hypothetical protein n=1 Tax=Bacillus sp. JCM 19034 TaxID=1481928 RepID=UPI0007811F09|nr:hypothetical protein [Bacillus sp. JCM 19034]
MPISIYNYEKSKMPLILEITKNTSLRNLKDGYYLDNDWQHGPNTLIVFLKNSEERFFVDEIKGFVKEYIEANPLDKGYLEEKQALYKEKQKTLVEVEYRENVDVNLLYEHGEVISRPRKSGIYNSRQHRKAFDTYRCKLNEIYLKMMDTYQNLSSIERAHFFYINFVL